MASKALPTLVSIKFSHYNEFARWSLQHCNIDFVEHGYAPIQHVVPVIRSTKGATEKIFFSDSALYDPNKEKNSATGTPIMVLENGHVLSDSWAIAEYAFTTANHKPLFQPELVSLARTLNQDVGECVRLIIYSHMLSSKNKNVFVGMCKHGTSGSWPTLLNLGFGSILTVMLRNGFHSNDKDQVEKSRIKLESVVKKLEEDWIVNRKSRYIVDDEISMYDLALASLMAPLIHPPLYNSGAHKKWLDLLYDQDEAFRTEVAYWRGTALGQYCFELYEQNRDAHPMTQ